MTSKTKRVIAVAGCKGGVGKTLVAVNLALALSEQGQRVVLMDGNLSVPDIRLALGLENDAGESFRENQTMGWEGEILSGPSGLMVLSPAADPLWRKSIGINDTINLIGQLENLASSLDTLIIDTAPGLTPDNVTLIQAAGEVLVVINQDVLSILDAARLIRLLNQVYGVCHFGIVVNGVTTKKSGSWQFERLQSMLGERDAIVLSYLGAIPFDKAASEALNRQQALLQRSPRCRAARAIYRLAHQIRAIPAPMARGRIEIFMPERIKEGV